MFEVFDVLRATDPVKYADHQPCVSLADSPGWVLARCDDTSRVFRDDETFSSMGSFWPSDD